MRSLRPPPTFAELRALLAAGRSSPVDGRQTSQSVPDADGDEDGAWSYEGETGPEHWATLSPAYSDCDGSRQSPIDLTNASPADRPFFQPNYGPAEAEVVDTGHAIQVNTTGGTLTLGETIYDLQQFHIHTPSEHTVDGTRYAAEIHLVHENDEGQTAVLALFVEEGDARNPALDDWIQGSETTLATYDASALLPERRSYFYYEGSLTTPPCTENVRWVVLDAPIPASSAHLDPLRAQYDGNARPIQPLNSRTIRHISTE